MSRIHPITEDNITIIGVVNIEELDHNEAARLVSRRATWNSKYKHYLIEKIGKDKEIADPKNKVAMRLHTMTANWMVVNDGIYSIVYDDSKFAVVRDVDERIAEKIFSLIEVTDFDRLVGESKVFNRS